MQLFSHFPFLIDMIDEDVADQLERRFVRVCEAADISPASPDALPIGIEIMADYATGLGRRTSARQRNGARGQWPAERTLARSFFTAGTATAEPQKR